MRAYIAQLSVAIAHTHAMQSADVEARFNSDANPTFRRFGVS